MPRVTKERRRQLEFLAANYAGVVAKQPRWDELRHRLLAIDGDEVVARPDEDLAKIIERGREFPGRGATLALGAPSQCHANSARLFEANADRVQIVTGYALSKDGLWRQHSWAIFGPDSRTPGKVIETTERRTHYFGFVLNPRETRRFCYENE